MGVQMSGDQKRVSDPLELELQLLSAAKCGSRDLTSGPLQDQQVPLNHWALFLAPRFFKHLDFKKTIYQIWILASLLSSGTWALILCISFQPSSHVTPTVLMLDFLLLPQRCLKLCPFLSLFFFFFISAIQAGHIFLICLHVHWFLSCYHYSIYYWDPTGELTLFQWVIVFLSHVFYISTFDSLYSFYFLVEIFYDKFMLQDNLPWLILALGLPNGFHFCLVWRHVQSCLFPDPCQALLSLDSHLV